MIARPGGIADTKHPDLYYPHNVEDLRKFYDYYMKDIPTGWEFTPKVRLCVLNPGNKDVVNRPERLSNCETAIQGDVSRGC